MQNGRIVDEKQTVSCVSRCLDRTDPALQRLMASPNLELILSNTTEAGIFYCKGVTLDAAENSGYAALLTKLLWMRFQAGQSGLTVLPCELIEHNGATLLQCVTQYANDFLLPENFLNWLTDSCTFCDTLVDRIVTGFPGEEQADDPMTVVCEPFFFWAIQCKNPCTAIDSFRKSGFDVRVCEDIEPYRMRKVRLLNGMHTASAAAALMSGFSTVGEMISDKYFREFLRLYQACVIECTPMAEAELTAFAAAVIERFENPFAAHRLDGICLNTVSKFTARCKAIMLYRNGQAEKLLSFTLAAILHYFTQKSDAVRDSETVLVFLQTQYSSEQERISAFLNLFDLTQYAESVSFFYEQIQSVGTYETLKQMEDSLCP